MKKQISFRATASRNFFRFALCASLLSLGVSSLRAQMVDTGCDTMVDVSFYGKMCSNGNFTITLNGAVAGTNHQTCNTVAHTQTARTMLKLDEPYTLTTCCGICLTHVYLYVPEGYTMYINGVPDTTIDTPGVSCTTGTVLYGKNRQQPTWLEPASFRPASSSRSMMAPGDGSWEIVVRKDKCDCDEEGAKVGSVNWGMDLGNLTDGRSAESLHLRQQMLSAASYTPAALSYVPPGLTTQIDVVRNVDNSLRQINAPDNLADIVVVNANEYEVRLYKPADVGAKVGGVYTVTGVPIVVWKVKNPNPPSTNRLQLIKTQGATTETHEYTWDAYNNMWALTEGGANGTRVETQITTYPTPYSRAVTQIIKDGNGVVASKTTRVFFTYPFGERLVNLIVDPDGAALTTTYTYFEDPALALSYKLGKVLSITYPDGSWEKYDYLTSEVVSVKLSSWKDVTLGSATTTNCRATFYGYTADDEPYGDFTMPFVARKLANTTELIEGKVVKISYYWGYYPGSVLPAPSTINGQPVRQDVTVHQNFSVSSSNSVSFPEEVSATVYFMTSAAEPFRDRIAYMDFPDGRRDTYFYEKGDWAPNVADPSLSVFTPNPAGLAERDTVTHGLGTQPDGVANKTTRDMTIRDALGRTVMSETYVYTGTVYERTGWTAQFYDNRSHLIETRRHNGQQMTTVWDGDLKMSEINETGEETTYTYDALMRVKTQTKKGVAANGSFPAQVDIGTTFNYDAEGRVVSQVVTGGALSLNHSSTIVRDFAGRVIRSTDATGLVTTTEYANGGRTVTVRRPGGVSQTTDKYLDGQIKSVTGTAVVTQSYDYGADATQTPAAEISAGVYAALPWTQVYMGVNSS